MSYKFSMGETVLSGTLTQLSGNMDLLTNGVLSASATIDTGVMTAASLVATTADINGGNIDGAIIGAASVAAGSFAALVGTSADINGVGDFSDTLTLSKGSGDGLVVTADADLNGSVDIAGALVANGAVTLGDAAGDDITFNGSLLGDLIPKVDSSIDLGSSALQFAEAHIDAGYIDAITATGTSTLATVDINGGAIDGTVIGANSAADGTFAAIVGSTITGSGLATLDSLHCDNVNLDGGNIDGVIIGASAQAAGSFTTVAGTLSTAAQPNITSLGTLGSLQVDNLSLDGNTLSSTAGVDLLITPLTGQQIVLDGAIVIDAGVVTGATSITSTNFVGAIDGVVGGNTPAAGSFTSLSGSGTLIVDGASSFNSGITVKATQQIDLGLSANTPFDVAADSLYFRDNDDDGRLKTMALSSFLDDIAGVGISVSGNQLVADGAGTPNNVGDNTAALTEGFNYSIASFSALRTWTLPNNPEIGDIVRVKLPAPLGVGPLFITGDGSDTIDGLAQIELSSPGAALNFVAISNSAWLIF